MMTKEWSSERNYATRLFLLLYLTKNVFHLFIVIFFIHYRSAENLTSRTTNVPIESAYIFVIRNCICDAILNSRNILYMWQLFASFSSFQSHLYIIYISSVYRTVVEKWEKRDVLIFLNVYNFNLFLHCIETRNSSFWLIQYTVVSLLKIL